MFGGNRAGCAFEPGSKRTRAHRRPGVPRYRAHRPRTCGIPRPARRGLRPLAEQPRRARRPVLQDQAGLHADAPHRCAEGRALLGQLQLDLFKRPRLGQLARYQAKAARALTATKPTTCSLRMHAATNRSASGVCSRTSMRSANAGIRSPGSSTRTGRTRNTRAVWAMRFSGSSSALRPASCPCSAAVVQCSIRSGAPSATPPARRRCRRPQGCRGRVWSSASRRRPLPGSARSALGKPVGVQDRAQREQHGVRLELSAVTQLTRSTAVSPPGGQADAEPQIDAAFPMQARHRSPSWARTAAADGQRCRSL